MALVASTAIAQVANSLSDRLATVGRYYGDAAGYIPIITRTDGIKYVATADGQAPFTVYNVGDSVADDATLAVCGINATGALVGCDPAYGETMLYALEDLQNVERAPGTMMIQCRVLFGTTDHCKITLLDRSTACYVCSGGSCAKTHC
ncbi:hypothetical protein QHF84_22510 [Polyangium sp. y55x31]|nr:hypothetical protein [Polyangium sp. y55x31]